jgi:hypothetical protein
MESSLRMTGFQGFFLSLFNPAVSDACDSFPTLAPRPLPPLRDWARRDTNKRLGDALRRS